MSVTFDEIVRQAYLENVDRGDMELLKVIEKVFYNGHGGGGGDSEDYSGIAFFDNSATFADVQAAISDDKLPILKFYIMGSPAYFYCCEHSTVWIDFISFSGLTMHKLRWSSNGNKQLLTTTLVSNQSPQFYGSPTALTPAENDSSTKLATTQFVNRAINNAIADVAISGISDPIKQALLQLARKVAYIDGNGQTYYNALYNALYPPINVDSISAVWNPPQDYYVYTTTPIDSLKAYLTVTATYDDQTTEILDASDYVLSGTLTAGTSVVTVTYADVTTTFNVTVVANVVESISATFNQNGNTIYNVDDLASLVPYLTVTATYTNLNTVYVDYPDYVLSGNLTVGTSTITVSYAGKTDTFTVTVTNYWTWEYDPSTDGILTNQSYIYTGNMGTKTEEISDGLLHIVVPQGSTSNNGYQIRLQDGNGNYDVSQGEISMRVKFAGVNTIGSGTVSDGFRVQMSQGGTKGGKFVVIKDGGAYKFRQLISTAGPTNTIEELAVLQLNTWYNFGLRINDNSYEITLDGSVVYSGNNWSTAVITYCGMYLIAGAQSTPSLCENLDVYIESIKFRSGVIQ